MQEIILYFGKDRKICGLGQNIIGIFPLNTTISLDNESLSTSSWISISPIIERAAFYGNIQR